VLSPLVTDRNSAPAVALSSSLRGGTDEMPFMRRKSLLSSGDKTAPPFPPPPSPPPTFPPLPSLPMALTYLNRDSKAPILNPLPPRPPCTPSPPPASPPASPPRCTVVLFWGVALNYFFKKIRGVALNFCSEQCHEIVLH
jgi:hypothetical protein